MDVVTRALVSAPHRNLNPNPQILCPLPPPMRSSSPRRIPFLLLLLLFLAAAGSVSGDSDSCPFSSPAAGLDDHSHVHDHDHDQDCQHHHHHHNHHGKKKLPEELAEEEDLMSQVLLDHHHHYHDHHHHHYSHEDQHIEMPTIGVWLRAMGCSLLVSMASLICLILLPVIFLKGKPSKAVVDFLAVFGAGAMLGDAFLHQLPHAFGGEHSHAHDHSSHHLDHGHSHSHSLEDLSIGLSILFGIVLFFLVEKIVRYVEDNSGGASSSMHGHHHHHKQHNKLKGDYEIHKGANPEANNKKGKKRERGSANDGLDDTSTSKKHSEQDHLRKRSNASGAAVANGKDSDGGEENTIQQSSDGEKAPQSNLVFGYLNLFSDGVHNFTDGMALGSAFLLHGSVGGWSRTLFLLAHEIPQEVGDFGILVRSGFSVPKALFFNFLSALVALAGTALALLLGKDPGQSSLIEGFTAGGFVYIAVAGVLPEMNDGKTTAKGTLTQLTAFLLGMAVALGISLVE